MRKKAYLTPTTHVVRLMARPLMVAASLSDKEEDKITDEGDIW